MYSIISLHQVVNIIHDSKLGSFQSLEFQSTAVCDPMILKFIIIVDELNSNKL